MSEPLSATMRPGRDISTFPPEGQKPVGPDRARSQNRQDTHEKRSVWKVLQSRWIQILCCPLRFLPIVALTGRANSSIEQLTGFPVAGGLE
jgi:hypothetical protein